MDQINSGRLQLGSGVRVRVIDSPIVDVMKSEVGGNQLRRIVGKLVKVCALQHAV